MFGSIGAPDLILGLLGMAVYMLVFVWPVARICQRVGFSPWLGILAIVPVVNLLLLWYLALMPWPAEDAVGATIGRRAYE